MAYAVSPVDLVPLGVALAIRMIPVPLLVEYRDRATIRGPKGRPAPAVVRICPALAVAAVHLAGGILGL